MAIAALAAGCSEAPSPGVARGAKGGDGPLRVTLGGEPPSLNPNVGGNELALVIGENIFSKLISLGADGTLIPDLAHAWEPSSDALSWTFMLRPDVRWHDGQPFTSADVVATFARIPGESWNRDFAQRAVTASAQGPHKVILRLKEPWAAFIPSLASYATSILPAHVYGDARWQGHPANDAPIGTGPFRFKSWDRGRTLLLEKNSNYFGTGPFVDSVEYDLDPKTDAATRLIAGEVDLIIGRPRAERISELAAAAGVRMLTAPGDGRTYLVFNMRKPPFDDLRVRRAINLALNRPELVRQAFSGFAAPAFGFYTPSVRWAYNGDARVPDYAPDEARRIVAGVPAARRDLALLHVRPFARIAEVVAQQLAAVGMRVSPALIDNDGYLPGMKAGVFDLAVLSGSQGPDPDSLSKRFRSNGELQVMGYLNPALDAVLDEGARASDVSARARAYFRAQTILAADLPIAPIAESVRVAAFRENLRGHHQHDALGLVSDYNFSLIRLRETGK